MRGADRSSNVQIAVKYIERVSIGMGINRPRTLPCGKFTITHIQIFRKCDCVRQKERERGGGAIERERKSNFACHGGRVDT